MGKYKLAFGLLIVLLTFSSIVVVQGSPILDNNVLLNPSFETGSNGWLSIYPNNGTEVSDGLAFIGNSSLKFNAGASQKREVSSLPQPIMYTSDTKYAFTVNYYNDRAPGTVSVIVNFLRGLEVVDKIDLGGLDFSTTNQWITKRFLIDVPNLDEPLESIQVSVIVNEDYLGTVWFDDLALQPVLPGRNVLNNPGFEESTVDHTGWICNGPKLDTDEKHSGKRASMIKGDPNNSFNNIHSVQFPYSKGETIRVTFYHKLATRQADVRDLQTRIRNAGNETFYEYRYWGNVETGKWQKQTYESSTKRDSDKFSFYYFVTSSFEGRTWIDDIEVLIIPEAPPEPVKSFICQKEGAEVIFCKWEPDKKQPFRYNIYMSLEPNFVPGIENLVISVPGEISEYRIVVPPSRADKTYYLAISAIDGGGQESKRTYSGLGK